MAETATTTRPISRNHSLKGCSPRATGGSYLRRARERANGLRDPTSGLYVGHAVLLAVWRHSLQTEARAAGERGPEYLEREGAREAGQRTEGPLSNSRRRGYSTGIVAEERGRNFEITPSAPTCRLVRSGIIQSRMDFNCLLIPPRRYKREREGGEGGDIAVPMGVFK